MDYILLVCEAKETVLFEDSLTLCVLKSTKAIRC